eukprot:TRINITY_DN21731_c0_g2_i1.p1 TRINITY_DN21731_c0_g2~~TRINITY_DN21731_c0_g2_i1.p1  ORF type:complete len:203 (-),score=20.22 TRINITY_DN21731_c0_g2_i1:126-734(-)
MAGFILHVRNVPCKVLEADFANAIQQVGLDESRYEIYFPKKLGRQGRYNNFGYGFVECSGEEDAEVFTRALQGFRFENIDSCKRLVIEPANSNAGLEARAAVESRVPDGVHEVTYANHAWGTTTSSFAPFRRSPEAPYFSESARMVEHNGMFPAAPIRFRRPDAAEVPPTRLAFDERSLAHLVAESTDALGNESSRSAFCFQ